MTAEDPRVTTARMVLAEAEEAIHAQDPEAVAWAPEAIVDRHGRLAYALRRLLEYVDEGAS